MTDNDMPTQDTVDLFVASAHGDFDQVKALLARYPALLNASASWGETAIGAAAQTAQVDIAELLLQAGAPMDICTAAMLGQIDTVARMLPDEPQGANAGGAHNLPLLYHAVIRGHADIAELLVSRGANLDAGAGHTTALHGTVMFDRPEMARWLLARGADANALNHDGKTPLRLAVDMQREAVAAVLREFGGKLTEEDTLSG